VEGFLDAPALSGDPDQRRQRHRRRPKASPGSTSTRGASPRLAWPSRASATWFGRCCCKA
jgi:hypothetical protein